MGADMIAHSLGFELEKVAIAAINGRLFLQHLKKCPFHDTINK